MADWRSCGRRLSSVGEEGTPKVLLFFTFFAFLYRGFSVLN